MQKGWKRDSQKWQFPILMEDGPRKEDEGVAPPEQNQRSVVMAWVLSGHGSYQKFLGAHEV